MLFNLNENVRVRLTDEGKKILRKEHDDFVKRFGETLSDKTKIFTLPQEDDEGFSTWQLWVLFHKFGEHIHMGCNPPFELNIEIPIGNSAPNTACTPTRGDSR